MVYDFEDSSDRSPPVLTTAVTYDPRDLESIVMLLELAAIELTPKRDATFTFDELLACAREYGGSEDSLDEGDARIVLKSATFLKRKGDRYRLV